MVLIRLAAVLMLVGDCRSQETCDDQATCNAVTEEALQANALLQVKAKYASQERCQVQAMAFLHLEQVQTRECLPTGLAEKHMAGLARHQSALLLSTEAAQKQTAGSQIESLSSADPSALLTTGATQTQ